MNIRVTELENENLERKPCIIPLSYRSVDIMLMKAIRQLGKGNGVSFEDIIKYIKANYDVEMDSLETYANKCLRNGIKNGTIEEINEGFSQEKYRLKILETDSKTSQKSISKKGDHAKIKKLTDSSKTVYQNVKEKVEILPFNSETLVNSKGQTAKDIKSTEYLDSILASKKMATETSILDTSVSNIEDVKPTKNKMQNAKSMAKNDEDQILKSDSVKENKKLKVKAAHPPTSEMVMNSIKLLKKRKGAKFEDIQKYIEKNYQVNIKVQKSRIKKFLKNSVNNGVVEKISAVDSEERYKIKKKTEKIKKDSEAVDRKQDKATDTAKKSSRNKTKK